MFSTIFYILILFYQNLYAGLEYNFNNEINKINQSILYKDYNRASYLIQLMENRYIFKNESVFKTKVLLSIKQPTTFNYSNVKSTDDYIVKSMILVRTNHHSEARIILKEGLKLFPEKDTLIKLYELFSLVKESKLKKSYGYEDQLAFNKNTTHKDSKWMLDLLRKNEKFLLY